MTENNGLFKEKTIVKLSKKINPTLKQKKAATEWIDLLERNMLTEEVNNYPRFMSIILSSLLGYDTKNFDFESNNIEFLFKNAKSNDLICFEVKGTKTKDLWASQGRDKKTRSTPVNQIIDYMMKYEIPYGALTNYKYFVLFDRNKSYDKYHKFNFLDIKNNPEKLKEFIAIFSKQYIESGFISDLEEESLKEEITFTKEFYKLYHETRLMLIKEFRENCKFKDPLNTPIFIAQIYLNRIMFILFAEDTGKLPKRYFEDTILDILKTKSQITEHTHSVSSTIRTMFLSLDKGSETPIKICAFNGSLFRSNLPETVQFKDLRNDKYFEEEHRDSRLKEETKLLKSDDDLVSQFQNISPIIKNILIMASFDFNTEVNVNILGHIFEQSISDLEELKNKTTSRRKRDGVYYTPEYITDYICRNTIIPYLSKSGTNNTKELVSEYTDNIPELEKKFNNIKILDPACGSGAFLIKAIDILLEIFKEIQNFKQISGTYTKEMKYSLKSQKGKNSLIRALKSMEKSGESSNWIRKNWEEQKAREIIENNIHGVDINGESVEITKLSLFLKMATKNKKLIDLSKNIIQGNSLIDNKEVDKYAFEWNKKFKEIMDNGGFDIIIGNPPYIRVEYIPEHLVNYYKEHYTTATGKFDISSIFIEKSTNLLKNQGTYSIISSYQFIYSSSGIGLRHYLASNTTMELLKFSTSQRIFEGATTYPGIFIFTKNPMNSVLIKEVNVSNNTVSVKKSIRITTDNFKSEKVIVADTSIIEKIQSKKNIIMGKDIGAAKCGVVSSADDVFFINSEIIEKYSLEEKIIYPILGSDNIQKWYLSGSKTFCIYPYYFEDENTKLIDIGEIKLHYPNIFNYLSLHEKRLRSRSQGRKDYSVSNSWYQLNRPREKWIYDSIKIIYPGTTNTPKFALDNDRQLFRNARLYSFVLNEEDVNQYKYLLCILNSTLCKYLMHIKCPPKSHNYYEFSTNFLDEFPFIVYTQNKHKIFVEKAEYIMKLTKEYYDIKTKFLRLVKLNYGIEKTSQKIESFMNISFEDFKKELDKLTKNKISISKQTELMDFFEKNKYTINELKGKIDKTDKEIDKKVYELYDLNDDEIKIIKDTI